MVSTGRHLWRKHPAVRSGAQLSAGERAADILKAAFGTWSLLGAIIAGIILWLGLVKDPGELHLNLGLSFLASVQGVILQIAANRGDRISAEVARHTQQNTDTLKQQTADMLELQQQQMTLLQGIDNMNAGLASIRDALGRLPRDTAAATAATVATQVLNAANAAPRRPAAGTRKPPPQPEGPPS